MDINIYYDKYQKERKTCLSITDFSNMMLMYPAMLVATADDDFDALEKQNLVESVKGATDGNYLTACEMYHELCWLATDGKSRSKEFLSWIAESIKDTPSIADIIISLMYATAECSEGTSKEEEKTINDIKNILNI